MFHDFTAKNNKCCDFSHPNWNGKSFIGIFAIIVEVHPGGHDPAYCASIVSHLWGLWLVRKILAEIHLALKFRLEQHSVGKFL